MKYLYSGPFSGVTLNDGGQTREVLLHPGKEVDLPPQHDYVKTLLALGHLTPVGGGLASKLAATSTPKKGS
jgi:hypothetical protein